MLSRRCFIVFHLLVFPLVASFALMYSSPSWSSVVRYKPMEMDVISADRLLIKGFAGDIEVVEKKTKAASPTISLQVEKTMGPAADDDDWSVTMKRNGSEVVIEVQGPGSKKDWKELLRVPGRAPRFSLHVSAPALPLEVFWQKGSIKAKDWKQNLKINVENGDISLAGGKGDIEVYIGSGSLLVSSREGIAKIESYQAKVQVTGVKGNVRLENFAGLSTVSKVEGDLLVNSYKGDTVVSGGKGTLEFQNGRSKFKVSNFDGNIKGRSKQGAVSASIVGGSKIRVRSEEGSVSVRARNSGAYVNVGSKEGALYVPNFLKLTRNPNINVRTGRLRGSKTGSIFVRTDSGSIKIR